MYILPQKYEHKKTIRTSKNKLIVKIIALIGYIFLYLLHFGHKTIDAAHHIFRPTSPCRYAASSSFGSIP